MIVSEATADRAAALLRREHPENLTGSVLLKALQDAEKILERDPWEQMPAYVPPYARAKRLAAPIITIDPMDDPLDDPRYQHGLSK